MRNGRRGRMKPHKPNKAIETDANRTRGSSPGRWADGNQWPLGVVSAGAGEPVRNAACGHRKNSLGDPVSGAGSGATAAALCSHSPKIGGAE